MPRLERSYNVPLRREWLKAPNYLRAKKAIVALRAFLVRHMKSENVLLGPKLNEFIWRRGIKRPPHHVKITAIKEEDGKVYAELLGFKFGPKVEEKKIEEEKVEERKEGEEERKEKGATMKGARAGVNSVKIHPAELHEAEIEAECEKERHRLRETIGRELTEHEAALVKRIMHARAAVAVAKGEEAAARQTELEALELELQKALKKVRGRPKQEFIVGRGQRGIEKRPKERMPTNY